MLLFFTFCLFVSPKIASVAESTTSVRKVVSTLPHWSFSGGQTDKKQRKKEKPDVFFKSGLLELSALEKVFPVQKIE
jgi:hypothetical protein